MTYPIRILYSSMIWKILNIMLIDFNFFLSDFPIIACDNDLLSKPGKENQLWSLLKDVLLCYSS